MYAWCNWNLTIYFRNIARKFAGMKSIQGFIMVWRNSCRETFKLLSISSCFINSPFVVAVIKINFTSFSMVPCAMKRVSWVSSLLAATTQSIFGSGTNWGKISTFAVSNGISVAKIYSCFVTFDSDIRWIYRQCTSWFLLLIEWHVRLFDPLVDLKFGRSAGLWIN